MSEQFLMTAFSLLGIKRMRACTEVEEIDIQDS